MINIFTTDRRLYE